MGSDRVLSVFGEEGRCYRHDDLNLERFLHLHTLPLPRGRQTQVCITNAFAAALLTAQIYCGDECDGCVQFAMCCVRLGHALHVDPTE